MVGFFFCRTCANKELFLKLYAYFFKKELRAILQDIFVIGFTPECCYYVYGSYFDQRKLLLFLKIHPLVFI